MSVRWELHCDRPGCPAVLELTGTDDRDTSRTLVRLAEISGWQLITWTEVDIDLCPAHVQPELGMKPPITDLSKPRNAGR